MAGALLLLSFGELAARWYVSGPIDCLRPSPDPITLYEMKPGHYEMDGWVRRVARVTYDIDPHGCRWWTPDGERLQPEATGGVLFGGSSLVWGSGLPMGQALPAQVWQRLPGSAKGSLPGVLDCSVIGYTLAQTAHVLAKQIDRTHPPVVVIPVINYFLYEPLNWAALTETNPVMRWLIHTSRLARVVHMATVAETNLKTAHLAPEHLDPALDELAAAARRNKATVMFVLLGDMKNPALHLEDRISSRGMLALAAANAPHGTEYYLADNTHWNAAGHSLVADEIAPMLAARLEALRQPPVQDH